MTIKDILFEYIEKTEGNVDFEEITDIILSKKPTSKWQLTHWKWYKTHIISPNGKYHYVFSKQIVDNISKNKTKRDKPTCKSTYERQTVSETINFIDNSAIVERELAIILGKVSHHIHPEIVKRIIEENKIFNEEFSKNCHPLLNVNNYFYENSDCVFPGIRRPINNEKDGKSNWKNIINEVDGTIFNDNTYPRYIWTYLSMNKSYSGGLNGSWGKSGLNAFELAHIFGHKVDEKELEKRVFQKFDKNMNPYSLFTSASNVVLIPKGLTKPTDKMDSIKICFYKRHLELYGNNLIGMEDFNENEVPEWYGEIKWLEPILPNDWENRIKNLLEFRRQHLLKKYEEHAEQNIL
jgi:hypothetical protein